MAAQSKHTPGPWEAEWKKGDNRLDDPAGYHEIGDSNMKRRGPVADTLNRDYLIAPEEDAANARLIAAAPDLLAACKLCLAQLVGLGQAMGELTRPADVDAMNAAEAAIAKAEGR